MHSWLLTTGLTFYEYIKKKYFIFLDIKPYSKGLWRNIKQRLFEEIPSSRLNLIDESNKDNNALMSDYDINNENSNRINKDNIFLEGNIQLENQRGKNYREFPVSDDENEENEENEDNKSDKDDEDINNESNNDANDNNIKSNEVNDNNNEINNNYIQNNGDRNFEETNSTKRTRKGGGALLPMRKKQRQEEQEIPQEDEINNKEIKIEKESDEISNSNLVDTNRQEINLDKNL